ncbi:MAG: hypothetical protein AAGF23_08725 [Acidobacteriota bacterium]
MILLAKGFPDISPRSFPQRLAEKLNSRPPAWPLDAEKLEEWRQMLDGWWESSPSFFVDCFPVDVDRAVAVVLFRHRGEYPPHPEWSPTASRPEFERWRDTTCLQVVKDRMPALLDLTCELMRSVEHPVLTGSELGTSPRDSWLAQMALYRFPDTPRLRIMVKNEDTVEIHGHQLSYDDALDGIRLTPDGEVELDDALQPGWQQRFANVDSERTTEVTEGP